MKHEHIIKTHAEVGKYFPKQCGNCRRVYDDEKEYIAHTVELGDTKHYDSIDQVAFFRNCDCGSTLGIVLAAETFGVKHAEEKAKTEGKSKQQILNENRARYNQWLHASNT